MCVIISKPKGVELSPEDVQKAYDGNKDGFGYMYFDPKEGRVIADKGINFTTDKMKSIVAGLTDYDAVFHFRIKTVGPIQTSNCHPFKVVHGSHKLYMMHNGTIRNIRKVGNKTDSEAFARLILQPFVRGSKNPIDSVIKNPALQELCENYISDISKLVFMDDTGAIHYYNKSKGEEVDGCWYSNRRAWATYTRPASYTSYNGHHKGAWSQRPNSYVANSGSTVTKLNDKRNADTEKKSNDTPPKTLTIGGELVVLSTSDRNFYADGVVSSVTAEGYTIRFDVKEEGVEKTLNKYFFKESQATGAVKDKKDGFYFFTEEEFASKKSVSLSRKVSDIRMERNNKNLSARKDSGTSSKNLSDVPATGSKTSTLTCVIKDPLSKMTFDGSERWNGILYVNPIDPLSVYEYEYGKDPYTFTFGDWVSLEQQDRYELLVENPTAVHLLLEDLTEAVSLQLEEAVDEQEDLYNEENTYQQALFN